jgi:4-amino-4-deoxy-L-arabinose transferase-like glycosyltransferase/putative flippase GtrA
MGWARTVDVVVPVLDEEQALPGCIEVLSRYLAERFPLEATITVVDNGSTDGTLRVANELASRTPGLRVLHLDAKGRGLALRTAWSQSEADVVAYMDVDLSTGLDALLPLVAPLITGHSDVAIGSRLAPGARIRRSARRELISRCYNALVRLSHGVPFSDAQCGFKAVRAQVVRPLVARIEDDAWFFDTELLLLAAENGLRVHEVPVDWVEDADSRVRMASTAWEDLRGLARVARARITGSARVDDLPRRSELRAQHPDAVRPGTERALSWQVGSFAAIGLASTLVTLLLYAALRSWLPPLAANLLALAVSTLFNTEANRRFTFPGARSSGAPVQIQGLLLLGLYYAFTSAALLGLHLAVPNPPRAVELDVLLAATVVATAGRFLLLRTWVFRHRRSNARQGERIDMTPTSVISTFRAARAELAAEGWQRPALWAILLLATLLYGWDIGSAGWGNAYYAAAVHSMSMNWMAFLFGSFDLSNLATVDKPPMAFWAQVVSAWVLGYRGWTVLLPQVVEGTATVFLLHRTVRRWAGEGPALLAALVLTLTPITVAINRDTNPDTLMVLWLVAAAYAFTRAVERVSPAARTRWLLLAGFLIGCGFLTKMLQAWIVVPAFGVAYLLGVDSPLRRRLLDLAAAGAMLTISSWWWVALHDLWPGAKPYIGSSQNGTAWSLVTGHNGIARILNPAQLRGGAAGSAGQAFTTLASLIGGPPGMTRLLAPQNAGQISWLLPLCVLVLVVVAGSAISRRRAGLPVPPQQRAGWLLWGLWLVVSTLVLSYAGGIFHSYYTAMIAPAVAAVTAAGLPVLWRHYRRRTGPGWLLLPGGVLITGWWACVVVSRDPSWNGWVGYVAAIVTLAAVAALVVARVPTGVPSRLGRRASPALAIAALLVAPGAWSLATALGSDNSSLRGGLPVAGPPLLTVIGRISPQGTTILGSDPTQLIQLFGAGRTGASTGNLSAHQRQILDYARRHAGGARIVLAVDGGAVQAAPYVINTNDDIIALGGFSGDDNVPTGAQLDELVRQGTLKFVVADPASLAPPAAGGASSAQAVMSRLTPVSTTQRDRWIRQHCAPVELAPSDPTPSAGSQQLYACH